MPSKTHPVDLDPRKLIETSVKFLTLSRQTSSTYRYNTRTILHRQSVAEHSYHVAVMAAVIGSYCDESIDLAALLQIALLHDVPEILTGDILYPVKNHSPEIKKFFASIEAQLVDDHLSVPDRLVRYVKQDSLSLEIFLLDCCDLLDLTWYCAEEVRCGNRTLCSILQNGLVITRQLIWSVDAEKLSVAALGILRGIWFKLQDLTIRHAGQQYACCDPSKLRHYTFEE